MSVLSPSTGLRSCTYEGNGDLWWGLRGSGPALCIATRYKARAYPVPVVFAGNLI